jgi:hypothetical protein
VRGVRGKRRGKARRKEGMGERMYLVEEEVGLGLADHVGEGLADLELAAGVACTISDQ